MAKILILEDRLIIAHTIGVMLENAGHKVSAICQKAEEAVSKTASEKPDLLILDLGLDDVMSGADVLTTVRKNGYSGKAVFLSAYPESSGRETIGNVEYDGYLVKPVTEDQLAIMVRDVLKR